MRHSAVAQATSRLNCSFPAFGRQKPTRSGTGDTGFGALNQSFCIRFHRVAGDEPQQFAQAVAQFARIGC